MAEYELDFHHRADLDQFTIGTGAWTSILLISRGKLAACLRL